MPNLNLHFSANLADRVNEKMLEAVNAAAATLFDEVDIKTRAQAFSQFRIGTAHMPRGFLHLIVAMSARSQEIEHRLSVLLADAMEQCLVPSTPMEVQLCVEIVHVETTSYVKRLLN